MKRALVVFNSRAGTLIDRGSANVRALVAHAFEDAGWQADVSFAHGRGIVRRIQRAATEPHDALFVGGGDGSASIAASVLAGSGKALGVLPLGTLNLLARDLGVPAPLELALAALARGRTVSIDLARLNGRMFHTLSGVGFFSHMAKAREETRGLWAGRLLSVGLAAVRALRHSQPLMLELDIDGRVEKIEAYAALVTSNRFGGDWRRLRLDEGVLEVHVAEHRHALSRIGHGAALLSGSWRSNPGLHSFTARKISIAHARKRHFVATDGERRRERAPLRYDIVPKALKVITPVHEAIQPALAAGATPT